MPGSWKILGTWRKETKDHWNSQLDNPTDRAIPAAGRGHGEHKIDNSEESYDF